MAVRAFAQVVDHIFDHTDNQRITAAVKVTVLGSEFGTLENFPTYVLEVLGVDVTALPISMRNAIRQAVIDDLQANSVPFTDGTDSVTLFD